MIIPLPNIDNMLHGSLMLQLHRTQPPAWFGEKLTALTMPPLRVQRRWQLKDDQPFSLRQQWYGHMISMDETGFCNTFLGRVAMEDAVEHRAYLCHEAKKQLSAMMNQLQQLPERLAAFPFAAMDGRSGAEQKRLQQEEDHIITRLKACVAGLFLEVQAASEADESGRPVLDEAAIYTYYYLETPPAESLLKQASPIVLPLPTGLATEVFIPLRSDRPNQRPSKLHFSDLRDPEKLFELEAILYDYGLLDAQSRFIKNKAKSHNKLMAAVYHMIVEAGIFGKHFFGSKQPIKSADIRSWLDRRYETNLSQEFRKLTPEDHEFARIKLPFLDLDPRFRKYRF